MANVSVTGASGQGTLDLGGFRNVTYVNARLETLADRADVAGVSPVRRIHHQAWFGLGWQQSGGVFDGFTFISWHKYLQLETESLFVGDPQSAYGEFLYFDIQPGGEMTFEVWW